MTLSEMAPGMAWELSESESDPACAAHICAQPAKHPSIAAARNTRRGMELTLATSRIF